MKKRLALLSLMSALALTLTGCGGGSSSSSSGAADSNADANNKETITIWCWDPNYNIPAMEKAKNFYLEKNPNVDFEMVDMAKADVEQKLTANLMANATNDLPDIVLIEDYNAEKYLRSYAGSFADLTDSIDYSQFVDYKVKLMTVEGRTYGVPFDSGVTVLYYRADILKEAGYEARDLENLTWTDYLALQKDIQAKTGKALFANDRQDTGFLRIMMQSAGTWYTNAEGKLNLKGNDVLEESLETLKAIASEEGLIPAVDWSTWIAPLASGDSASVATGIWITGTVKQATDQSGLWAATQIPRLNHTASKNASNLGGSSWYVLESSKEKDIAIDFLKEIYAGNDAFYQDILTEIGAVGSYQPALAGEAFQKEDPFFGGQKVMADVASWMKDIPAVNYGSYTYEIDDAIKAQLSDFYDGKIDVKTLLENAHNQVAPVIGE